MQIPFVGFQPIRTSEHMAAAGTFALLQAYAFLSYLRSKLSRTQFKQFFIFAVTLVAGIVFAGVIVLTYAGYVAPWSGRFYSLWDTGYAKIHIPIITSVSEHQPTTWTSFFFDLHILVCIFPAGVYFCIKEINDERVFSKKGFYLLHARAHTFSLYIFSTLSHPIRHICILLCWCHGQIDFNAYTGGLRSSRNRHIKVSRSCGETGGLREELIVAFFRTLNFYLYDDKAEITIVEESTKDKQLYDKVTIHS
jgi:hypothetical protein